MSTSWCHSSAPVIPHQFHPSTGNRTAHGYSTQQVDSALPSPFSNLPTETYTYYYNLTPWPTIHCPPGQTMEVPRDYPFPLKEPMNTTQYRAAPGYDDDCVRVPSMGTVSSLAKDQFPKRTKGRCTPHPTAAPTPFREQLRMPLTTIDGRVMDRHSEYSIFIPPSPSESESSGAPTMPFEGLATPKPWAGAAELVDGQNYFKIHDPVFVAVWSTRQNKNVWIQGVVTKPVLRVNRQGQEERLYNVSFVNPDTQQNACQEFAPSPGYIRAIPCNEALPGPHRGAIQDVWHAQSQRTPGHWRERGREGVRERSKTQWS